MYEPSTAPPRTTLAAQSLYEKLQKLSEDIKMQHSILNAQKETVLKSRQRTYDIQKVEPAGAQTHLVHTHAGTVLQHRAMLIKHYGLIQQHKQMVKEQGIHVQNLTSTLLNIQQETNVVDELMNTKMAESKSNNVITSSSSSPSSSSSLSVQSDAKATRAFSTHKMADKHQNFDIAVSAEQYIQSSPDITSISPKTNITITDADLDAETNDDEIIITTTTSTTTTTPTSTTTETTTISSTSTPSSTTTTSTTTTTTTNNPVCDSGEFSPCSISSSSCDSPMSDSPILESPYDSPCASPSPQFEIPLPLSP